MTSVEKSLTTTNTPSTTNVVSTTASSVTPNTKLPDDLTLKHASRLAIVEDKAIMMDYWSFSLDKKCLIGIKDTGEKLLVKSADEYTSPIQKFYKSNEPCPVCRIPI